METEDNIGPPNGRDILEDVKYLPELAIRSLLGEEETKKKRQR